MTAAERAALFVIAVFLVWGVWSYVSGGAVFGVVAAARDADRSLAIVRAFVERAGVFGPVVYVAAVVVEVLIAPIPGALLYAPGGAIFGGGLGGTLSLAGNVIGAAIAAWIATRIGGRFVQPAESSALTRLVERLRRRGVLLIALLRLNPLTSSDLVSYAAGIVGIPVWRVAAGTLIGMAPLCYAQSYASEQIFRIMPSSGLVVLVLGVLYLGVVVWIVTRYVSPHRR